MFQLKVLWDTNQFNVFSSWMPRIGDKVTIPRAFNLVCGSIKLLVSLHQTRVRGLTAASLQAKYDGLEREAVSGSMRLF
jgi:hypothetical protein